MGGPPFFQNKCQLFSILACHGHTSQRLGLLFFENVTPLNVRAYFFPKISFSVTPRCSGLLWVWVALGCFGVFWAGFWLLLAALDCYRLLWGALGCSGLLCVDLGFLGCSGLLWGALGCSGLLWHALGLVAALGCSGLLWAALGCSGLLWVALGFQTSWYGIIRNTQMLEGHFNIRVRMVVMARISINTRFLLRCRICVVVS